MAVRNRARHGLHVRGRPGTARPRLGKHGPLVLAVVEFDEGLKVLTNVINVAPEDVAIGMPVEVTFEELDGTTRLPVFSPR